MVEEKILATGNQPESADNPSRADKDAHTGGKLLASIVRVSDSDAERLDGSTRGIKASNTEKSELEKYEEYINTLKPKNITEFNLEKLFYLRKSLYILDGQLYMRVKNHLEEIPDNKLETVVLSVLDDKFQLIGKRSKIKAVADLIRLRTPDYFRPVDYSHKQLAFNDGVMDAKNWSFADSMGFDSLDEITLPTDSTFQLNFNADKRLFINQYYYNPIQPWLMPKYLVPNLALQYYQLPKMQSDIFNDAIEMYNNSLQTAVQLWDDFYQAYYKYSPQTYTFNNLLNILFNTPTPTADKFFAEIANGNNAIIERIYQMIGCILVPGNEAKAYFLFHGPSNSGKTVLGNFLEGYFPSGKVTSLDIKRLGSQFLPDSLSSSCLNLSMDLPSGKLSAGSVAVLKMLTGDDLITQEVKFKDAKPYRGRCKFVFSTNADLEMQEYDEAFLNRTICIPFEKSIPKDKQDLKLLSKLEEERAGITAKALACYYFLRANNFKFSGSDSIKPKVKYRMNPNETIEQFADEMCIFTYNQTDKVATKDLHASYLEFCRVRGIPEIASEISFSQRFIACFPLKVKSVRINSNTNGYCQVKLLETPVEFETASNT